jgi:hypothetical protein
MQKIISIISDYTIYTYYTYYYFQFCFHSSLPEDAQSAVQKFNGKFLKGRELKLELVVRKDKKADPAAKVGRPAAAALPQMLAQLCACALALGRA